MDLTTVTTVYREDMYGLENIDTYVLPGHVEDEAAIAQVVARINRESIADVETVPFQWNVQEFTQMHKIFTQFHKL